MKEDCARAILRLIGLITILVGASLATAGLVVLIGTSSIVQGAPEGFQVKVTGLAAEMGLFAILSYVVIAAWGFALYVLSPKLAAKIVE